MVPVVVAYAVALLGSTLAAAVLAVAVRSHADRPGAVWFGAGSLGLVVWCGAQFVGTLDAGYAASVFWLWIAFAGSEVVVMTFLLFALSYTGRGHLVTRRTIAVLSIEPILIEAALVTNESHHLILADVTLHPDLPLLDLTYGPAYFPHLAYSYLLLGASLFFLVELAIRSRDVHRRQAVSLVVAVVTPWAANVVDTFGDLPVNLTEPALAITAVAVWIAVFEYDLIDLQPVARSSVVDTLADGVVVIDGKGRVVDANPAARDLLGLDADVVGSRATEVLPAVPPASGDGPTPAARGRSEDADVRFPAGREGGATGGTDGGDRTDDGHLVRGDLSGESIALGGEERTRTESGDDPVPTSTDGPEEVAVQTDDGTRHLSVEATPVAAAGTIADGVALVFHDVTERRRHRRRLERQNERLDEFASVVSHDLRNPLTVAKGNLDLVARDVEDDETAERVDRVDSNLDRIERIVEDVLALARQEGSVSDFRPVALNDVARRAWNQVRTGDARLETGAKATVYGDESRLCRALENLFRNAVEHGSTDARGPEDDPAVTVRVGPLASREGFYVEDDGPGIPPDEREAVLRTGYSGTDGGTGLGLAIVADVASAHDWSLTVSESAAGGARFEVTDARVDLAGDE